jgi:Arc/MetJ-type ribon-helix-helix transcriptional regulator
MKWTTQEENFVLKYLDKYKLPSELPAVAMAEVLKGRSPTSIIRKARRLAEEERIEWTVEQSKELFTLYLEGLPTAEIKARASVEVSLEEIEKELKNSRAKWNSFIVRREQLPENTRLKLDTIKFYIENYNTDSDFIRKALQSKVRNG